MERELYNLKTKILRSKHISDQLREELANDVFEIEKLVNKTNGIHDVSGISLEQLKLQKECYRERKERNGKATAYGEAHTDEIREGVIDHLIALFNYR